ncbi:MAG: hypothetical protein MI974_15700 [Chitinophagales bacterium]|nr:hypothetical protein [Chitinophagales bacterium]
MNKMILIAASALLLIAATCNHTPQAPKYELGQAFKLAAEEEMSCNCDAPTIRFDEIKEDSRCPKYTNCIWEGQAIVSFTLIGKTNSPLQLIAREGQPELVEKEVDGYRYRLEQVLPYPEGKKINPKDYMVKLVVEKL